MCDTDITLVFSNGVGRAYEKSYYCLTATSINFVTVVLLPIICESTELIAKFLMHKHKLYKQFKATNIVLVDEIMAWLK